MRFEDYFSFEAIVGDLIRWRLRGKDLGGVLPPRRDWLRAGLKGRKGVPSARVQMPGAGLSPQLDPECR